MNWLLVLGFGPSIAWQTNFYGTKEEAEKARDYALAEWSKHIRLRTLHASIFERVNMETNAGSNQQCNS